MNPLEELLARERIRQLAQRYALTVDGKDLDGIAALFVEDVNNGRYGSGREASRPSTTTCSGTSTVRCTWSPIMSSTSTTMTTPTAWSTRHVLSDGVRSDQMEIRVRIPHTGAQATTEFVRYISGALLRWTEARTRVPTSSAQRSAARSISPGSPQSGSS